MTTLTHHPGLTNEAYHALKAISPSQIKVLGRSPLHYFDQFLAEDREKREPTPAPRGGLAPMEPSGSNCPRCRIGDANPGRSKFR